MYYSIRPRSSILKYYSNYHYLSMNLFELDENLNFKWNNYIKDRNLYTIGGTWGQLKNSVSKFSNRVTLQPKIQDSTITFSYSSSKDTLIKRVEYNIKNGNLIEETPIFNNDQISSFCPGYQFPIGNNEFVTLLIEEDFYLVRYKLLK